MHILFEALEKRALFSSLASYGDADGNNVVDAADYLVVAKNFETSTTDGASAGDFNNDGRVNAMDFDILATNYGHRWMTERYIHIAFDNDTNKLVVGESNDAVHWEHYYEPNYTPAVGDVRDVSSWYDEQTQTWFIAHTSFDRLNFGSSFAIASSKDLQTFTPFMQIDCSSVVNGTNQSPWAPQFLPSWYKPDQPRTHLTFMQSYDGSKNYCVPVDLSSKTQGTIFPISGLGSDPFIIPPDAPTNPFGKYIGLGGAGGMHYRLSGSFAGPYTSLTSLEPNGDEHNEAPFWLPLDDGSVNYYACGDHGTIFFHGTIAQQSDGTSTIDFGPEQSTTGTDLMNGGSYNVGQGDMVDRKVLGLWT